MYIYGWRKWHRHTNKRMSIHEIHPKSQNIFNSQIFKHSSTKICFKYVRLMPISLLSVKYGLWVKGVSQARSVRLWLGCLGMAGQHFWFPNQNWQTVGSLSLGLFQLVSPGLTLAEIGKNIPFKLTKLLELEQFVVWTFQHYKL